MVKRIIVVKPEARRPLICAVVSPLALPTLPLQKIIAVAAEALGAKARTRQQITKRNRVRRESVVMFEIGAW
jgi:hypothetical protein